MKWGAITTVVIASFNRKSNRYVKNVRFLINKEMTLSIERGVLYVDSSDEDE